MKLDRGRRPGLSFEVDPICSVAKVRYWDPSKSPVFAVVDIPADHIEALGGLKQQRVRGSLSGADFASSVMPAGNGHLALSVSKAMMAASHLAVSDDADVEISGTGRD